MVEERRADVVALQARGDLAGALAASDVVARSGMQTTTDVLSRARVLRAMGRVNDAVGDASARALTCGGGVVLLVRLVVGSCCWCGWWLLTLCSLQRDAVMEVLRYEEPASSRVVPGDPAAYLQALELSGELSLAVGRPSAAIESVRCRAAVDAPA